MTENNTTSAYTITFTLHREGRLGSRLGLVLSLETWQQIIYLCLWRNILPQKHKALQN